MMSQLGPDASSASPLTGQVADPPRPIAWTDAQVRRLEQEWRQTRRAFAYHPFITVHPLAGDPPHEFQVDYRVRTLGVDASNQLQLLESVSMHLLNPAGYPAQPPIVRPLAAVYHPNVAWEGVYFASPWHSGQTLADLIARVGELLAWRSYDPQSVVNASALQWMQQNYASLPLDTQADFSEFAGGEPLGRIARDGPATLHRLRAMLDSQRDELSHAYNPTLAAQAIALVRNLRQALGLFLDEEVPAPLRDSAMELNAACEQLLASLPAWEFHQRRRDVSSAIVAAAGALEETENALLLQIDALDRLMEGPVPDDAAAAIKRLPPMPALQAIQLKLPPLVASGQQQAGELQDRVKELLLPAPHPPVPPDRDIGKQLSAQEAAGRQMADLARQAADRTLSRFLPVLEDARAQAAALEQVIAWREYVNMVARAKSLTDQAMQWRADGMQACFVTTAAGEFGPFQLEQSLDLMERRLAIRSLQRGQVEVIDAVTAQSIGQSGGGEVSVSLDPENEANRVTFRLTQRCDDLLVQLDFIVTHTTQTLARLAQPVQPTGAWCGRMCAVLGQEAVQRSVREAHRRSVHQWRALSADLGSLWLFKQRMATFFMLQRMVETLPRIKEQIADSRKEHAAAAERIAALLARCARDETTGRPIIPARLIERYQAEVSTRQKLEHDIAGQESLMRRLGQEAADRLASPRDVGRPELAAFALLPALSQPLAALAPLMSDEVLAGMAASLEGILGIALPVNAAPPQAGAVPVEAPAPVDTPPESLVAPVPVAAVQENAPVEQNESVSDPESAAESAAEPFTLDEPTESAADDDVVDGFFPSNG